MKKKQNFLKTLLALLVILSLHIGCSVLELESEDFKVTEKPIFEAIEKPNSEATEKPNSEVTEKPNSEATEEPNSEVTEKPISEATEEPNSEVTEKPNSEVTEKPISEVTEVTEEIESNQCPGIETARAIQLEAEKQVKNLITETNYCEKHSDCYLLNYIADPNGGPHGRVWGHYSRICRRYDPFIGEPRGYYNACYPLPINKAERQRFQREFPSIENKCLTALKNCSEDDLRGVLA